MVRRGRRPGDADTRATILAAARATFSERGYDNATIRAIAEAADVDPSLVHHYFGPKADLYAAAIAVPISPTAMTEGIMSAGIDQAGSRVARTFFTVWENPAARSPLLAMIRGAMTGNDAGVDAFRQFLRGALLSTIASEMDGPDRDVRVELAASHLVGVAMLRYVIELEPLASAPIDEVIALISPRLQSYLTG